MESRREMTEEEAKSHEKRLREQALKYPVPEKVKAPEKPDSDDAED